MKFAAALTLSLFACLVGCGNKDAEKKAKEIRQSKRDAAITKALDAPPKEKRFKTSQGDVLMLELPVGSNYGSLEVQRCFVFTSKDTGQSNMTCPHPPADEFIAIDDADSGEH